MVKILYRSLFIPVGFEDSVECKKHKWIKINNIMINGRIKWKDKKRFGIELLIENPSQIYIINIFPICGMFDIRLVITVAPQKDICPQENIS